MEEREALGKAGNEWKEGVKGRKGKGVKTAVRE